MAQARTIEVEIKADARSVDQPAEPPREDLIRMLPLSRANFELREEPEGDGNTLVGYASVFNEWAEIDSWWEGRFRERVMPGAFRKTLKERGDQIKVLFNHGFDPSIGDKPLGKPALQEEDERGLYVEVPLDDTSYNRDLKESLRSGALDGMSIRFSVVREEWHRDTEDEIPERTIHEIKLYEYGPVTWPAFEATSAGVRSAADYRDWREQRTTSPAKTDPDEAASTSDGAATTSEEAEAASTPDEAARTSADEERAAHLADIEREQQLFQSKYGIETERE
jgi:HK97 family phage prohead protease